MVYNRSGNLRRAIKKALDQNLEKLRETLTNNIDKEESEDFDAHLNWGAAIGQALFEVDGQRGFSKELLSEMEVLRDEGLALIQNILENEPLNLTEEELQQEREEWTRAPRKCAKRTRRHRDMGPPPQKEKKDTTGLSED